MFVYWNKQLGLQGDAVVGTAIILTGLFRVILSEVFVTIGVEDGLVWVVPCQVPGFFLTVSVFIGATVVGEAGRHVDERSGLGIGTGGGGVPEGTAEVDRSELVGIWARYFVSDRATTSEYVNIRTGVRVGGSICAGAVVGELREVPAAD